MSELPGKDRRTLRALGHHLRPVLQIGQHGVTESLVDAAEQALTDHELIKVRVLESAPSDRRETARELATRTGAELAQVLGRTFLLYRPHPEEPKLVIKKRRQPIGLREAREKLVGAPRAPARSTRAKPEGRGERAEAGSRSGSTRRSPAPTAKRAPAGKRAAPTARTRTQGARKTSKLPPRRHR